MTKFNTFINTKPHLGTLIQVSSICISFFILWCSVWGLFPWTDSTLLSCFEKSRGVIWCCIHCDVTMYSSAEAVRGHSDQTTWHHNPEGCNLILMPWECLNQMKFYDLLTSSNTCQRFWLARDKRHPGKCTLTGCTHNITVPYLQS
jgi:hypothetical protein